MSRALQVLQPSLFAVPEVRDELYEEQKALQPRHTSQCKELPCPFASCEMHLASMRWQAKEGVVDVLSEDYIRAFEAWIDDRGPQPVATCVRELVGASLDEIAEALSMSRETLRRVETAAMHKLQLAVRKDPSRADWLPDDLAIVPTSETRLRAAERPTLTEPERECLAILQDGPQHGNAITGYYEYDVSDMLARLSGLGYIERLNNRWQLTEMGEGAV